MVSDGPRPTPDVKDIKNGKKMLVRVEACSISPGDTIMLSGACDKVQGVRTEDLAQRDFV